MGGKPETTGPCSARLHGPDYGNRAYKNGLLQVLADVLGQVEHRYLRLATEQGFELVVGVDVAAIDRVLQLVLLNIGPDLAGYLGSRERGRTDYHGQRADRGKRLHERRVWFAC
ncbi:hypothetical protein SBBP2_260007 [Burkholderiales bacterium]|nr:hypothetical protein SBBP2_260007 [Burkholderiales bacterium]